MDRFTLEITLGNDAMQTPEDIARALRVVADRVETTSSDGGDIRDANGNTVGRFEVQR